MYYYGYFPLSHDVCKYAAFFINAIAFADFHTLATVALYLAAGQRMNLKRFHALITLSIIWVWSLGISCLPFNGLIGQYGYDAAMGKCHIINCDHDKSIFPAGAVILSFGVGIPCIVLMVSYAVLIYRLVMSRVEAVKEKREIVFITLLLIMCYLLFILPIYIVEWITEFQAGPIASVLICTWYWLIYIINVFVYILYSPSCRDAIRCFMLDILFILKLRKPHQLKESVNLSSLQDMSKIHKPNCLP